MDERYRALAVDFDGTLTTGSRPSEQVLHALDRCRREGVKLVLVTGRILDELRTVFPDFEQHFDATVAENGGVLLVGGIAHALATPVGPVLAQIARQDGIDVRAGSVLLACSGRHEHVMLEEIRRLGLDAQLVRNRDELMVLPAGVTKGSGLREALSRLGLSTHDTVAVGDAENDHALLATAELGVAVANAVDSLKEQADVVLGRAAGDGVIELVDGGLLRDRHRVVPNRWRIALGSGPAGESVTIAATGLNLLIGGGSGDGKSYVAGLIAEQLIALGYSTLIVDPEGDHVGLARLPDVIVVGGDRHLPPAPGVVSLLSRGFKAVIVDLSHLAPEAKDSYLIGLPAAMEAQRISSGLPHWVIVDEAHRILGRPLRAPGIFDPMSKGHCLVTWRPDRLAGEVVANVDVALGLTNLRPDRGLVDVCAAVAGVPRSSIAGLLSRPPGRVVVAARGGTPGPCVITPAARETIHFRHEHKYAVAGTSPDRRFYFRSADDRLTGRSAGNLVDFEAELAVCERPVLRHHCPGRDFSRWIADVFHETALAAEIDEIERDVTSSSPAPHVEATRLRLLAVLHTRWHRDVEQDPHVPVDTSGA